MKRVDLDLTLPVQSEQDDHPTAAPHRLRLGCGMATCAAVVYDFAHDSMAGTSWICPDT